MQINWFRQQFNDTQALPPRETARAASSSIASAKEHPYLGGLVKRGPLVGIPRSTKGLNGKGKIEETFRDASGTKKIFCQELTFGYLGCRNFLDEVAQSAESASAFFNDQQHSPRKIGDLMREVNSFPEGHRQVVSNENFGKWLLDIAGTMTSRKIRETGMILTTSDHMLGVRIEWKQDPDGEMRLCLGCYDANGNPKGSGNHRRFEVKNLDTLRERRMDECFTRLTSYFSDSIPANAITLMGACPDIALASAGDLRYASPGTHPEAMQQTLFRSMQQNVPSAFHAACEQLRTKVSVAGTAAVPFLALKDSSSNRLALHMAIESGFDDMVRSYAKELMNFNVGPEEAYKLFKGVQSYNPPALDSPVFRNEDERESMRRTVATAMAELNIPSGRIEKITGVAIAAVN